jgi:hypothetical protein
VVECWLDEGIERTMNRYNRVPPPAPPPPHPESSS